MTQDLASLLTAYFSNNANAATNEPERSLCVIDPFGAQHGDLASAAQAWAQQFQDCQVTLLEQTHGYALFSLTARYSGYYDFHLPDGKTSTITGFARLSDATLTLHLDFAQLQAALNNGSDKELRSKLFAPRISIEQIEEDYQLAPKFDKRGLIPVITTDYASGEVLMHGYMNQEALERSIQTGQAHYWSRSRQLLWHKGASSGLYQHIIELRIDDDQDVVWMRVRVDGNQASCHVGYRSCFYRAIPMGEQQKRWQELKLEYLEKEKVFDPLQVYGDVPNPTLV